MRSVIVILSCLPVLVFAGADQTPPPLSDAQRVDIYFLGTQDLNTPATKVRDVSLVHELGRLIEHSQGVWQPHPTPWSTGDYQVSFYKEDKLLYTIGVGEDFFVHGEVGIPGRTCYIKNIPPDDAKAIRKIISEAWWSRLTNRSS